MQNLTGNAAKTVWQSDFTPAALRVFLTFPDSQTNTDEYAAFLHGRRKRRITEKREKWQEQLMGTKNWGGV